MTKDLTILVKGTMKVDRKDWLNTFEFIDKVAENINKNLSGGRAQTGSRKSTGMTLYSNGPGNYLAQFAMVAAELAGLDVKHVMKTNDEWKADADMKKKNVTMKYPLLELADGRCIFESSAIASHFARQGEGLFGKSPFELGQVEQWISFMLSKVMP